MVIVVVILSMVKMIKGTAPILFLKGEERLIFELIINLTIALVFIPVSGMLQEQHGRREITKWNKPAYRIANDNPY
jgi:hypothetical protein